MHSLKEIQSPVQAEMQEFEMRFRHSMKSKVSLLDKITHYIVKRKGKQMRPLFVFLSAGINGKLNDKTFRAAILIELLHTATLVHDDVVDDSNLRRGFFSINALWKNKIAVLVGDYLLSRGLLLAIDNNDFDLLEITSEAVKMMSEGELLQIEKARRLDIDEDIYFDIVRRKTASLIASCCACGMAATNNNAEDIARMKNFGEKVGIAFQIKDDLFDYENKGSRIGKPTGIDIKEQKMTLPLIYALRNADKSIKRKVINTIKNNNNDPKKVSEVIDFVLKSGGIEYSIKKMREYEQEALDIINHYPDNEFKKSLIGLVAFTTNRNH